jgi:hypothetical protein
VFHMQSRPRRLPLAAAAAIAVVALSAAGASASAATVRAGDTAALPAPALAPVPVPVPVPSASGNLFASVSESGTLVSGTSGARVTVLGTGQDEVTFPQNVSGCAYVATTVNAYSQALQAYTAGGHLSPDGVYVETKNQGGGLTAGPFNLVVDCGRPGWSYAVVGYSANLVRSTPGTTLTNLGVGRYDVTFPSSVSSCAYLATVGDPGNSLVYNPAGVYTGSGPDADTVYLETKNTAGGLSSGIPFHLAVVCPGAASANFAVVNASGLPVRTSPLTSSYQTGTGSYQMITGSSLAGCATVATRGSVDTSVPYTPATVEIVPGNGGNSIGIQVRDLLSAGGNLDNQSFHAAAVC